MTTTTTITTGATGQGTNLWESSLGEDTVVRVSKRQQWINLQLPDSRRGFDGHMDLHEETGLSASTITDDDEFATDFRHLVRVLVGE